VKDKPNVERLTSRVPGWLKRGLAALAAGLLVVGVALWLTSTNPRSLAAYVLAPGATAGLAYTSGRVHERDFLVVAVAVNVLLYALVAQGVFWLVARWRRRHGA